MKRNIAGTLREVGAGTVRSHEYVQHPHIRQRMGGFSVHKWHTTDREIGTESCSETVSRYGTCRACCKGIGG